MTNGRSHGDDLDRTSTNPAEYLARTIVSGGQSSNVIHTPTGETLPLGRTGRRQAIIIAECLNGGRPNAELLHWLSRSGDDGIAVRDYLADIGARVAVDALATARRMGRPAPTLQDISTAMGEYSASGGTIDGDGADEPDVTGRDDFVMAKSLVYSIACIQSLPVRYREDGDMLDMVRTARSKMDMETLARIAIGVERHVRIEIDMFPDLEPNAINAERIEYEMHISQHRKERAELDASVEGERSATMRDALAVVLLPEMGGADAFASLATAMGASQGRRLL